MSIFDEAKRRGIVERIDKLSLNNKALWGKMTAAEMLCHCSDGFKMALGEREVADKSNFFLRNFAKPLVLYVVPIPKGAPAANEINPHIDGTKPADFEADKQILLDYIEKLCTVPENYAWAKHASFGQMNRREWGVLAYKHLDHHLKQFGI